MTDKNPTGLQPTHEIYGYLDANNEPMELTDPEPVCIYGASLYTPTGDRVGDRRGAHAYEEQNVQRNCGTCHGTGKVNHAKNRHYEDWKPCHELNCRNGIVDYTTMIEKPGARRWAVPDHDTTLLLRALRDKMAPFDGVEIPACGDPDYDDGAF